jgi:hypothetical protein
MVRGFAVGQSYASNSPAMPKSTNATPTLSVMERGQYPTAGTGRIRPLADFKTGRCCLLKQNLIVSANCETTSEIVPESLPALLSFGPSSPPLGPLLLGTEKPAG